MYWSHTDRQTQSHWASLSGQLIRLVQPRRWWWYQSPDHQALSIYGHRKHTCTNISTSSRSSKFSKFSKSKLQIESYRIHTDTDKVLGYRLNRYHLFLSPSPLLFPLFTTFYLLSPPFSPIFVRSRSPQSSWLLSIGLQLIREQHTHRPLMLVVYLWMPVCVN